MTTVADVMTPGVETTTSSEALRDAARTMREGDFGSMPVVENERLVGMVTDRDIVIRTVAEGQDIRTATARETMSPRILYCFDDQTVEDVLENMGEQQIRRLPVVDRDKRLVGVVSLGDLSKAAKRKAGDALKEISQPTQH